MAESRRNPRRVVNPRVDVSLYEMAATFSSANAWMISDPSPLSQVLKLIRDNDYRRVKELIQRLVDASALQEREFLFWRQLGALVTKVERPGAGDLEQEALKSFLSTEKSVEEANWRLGMDRTLPEVPDPIRGVILRARHMIAQSLPPLTTGVVRRVITMARHGPGVSIGSLNRHRTSPAWKYGATAPTCTPRTEPYALWLLTSELRRKALSEFSLEAKPLTQLHNRVAFVPKDATRLRTIAIEPSLNVEMQLGVHEYLTRILSSLGNSVLDQGRNQLMAWSGSLTNQLATLDLSNASDSVGIALVWQLLPHDWFSLLYDLRCPYGKLPDGSLIEYAKFSSMGNGYTFSLETLIFLSLARALDPDASAYGDDIIVGTPHYPLLVEVLQFCGFSVNTAKSFSDGPFRESCGADWYNGKLVTPKYWRASERPLVTEVYTFLNSLISHPLWNWGPLYEYLTRCVRSRTSLTFGLRYYLEDHSSWYSRDHDGFLAAPLDYLKGIGAVKWNPHYQNWDHKTLAFVPDQDDQSWFPYTALTGLVTGSAVLPLRGCGSYRIRWVLGRR